LNIEDSDILKDELPEPEFNRGLTVFLGIIAGLAVYLLCGFILFKIPHTLYFLYNCSIGLAIGGAISYGVNQNKYIDNKILLIFTLFSSIIACSMFLIMNHIYTDNHNHVFSVGKLLIESWHGVCLCFIGAGIGMATVCNRNKHYRKRNIFILIILLSGIYYLSHIIRIEYIFDIRIEYLFCCFVFSLIMGIFVCPEQNTLMMIKKFFVLMILLSIIAYLIKFHFSLIFHVCVVSLGAGMLIFLGKNRFIEKKKLFILTILTSFIVFMVNVFLRELLYTIFTLNEFEGIFSNKYRVLLFVYLFVYILYSCLFGPAIRKITSNKSGQNKYISVENLLLLTLFSSFLIYSLYSFSLYNVSKCYVDTNKIGFYDFIRYINKLPTWKPLTLEQEWYCMCEEGDSRFEITSEIVSLYSRITYGKLGENTLLLLNIQLWIFGFFLAVLCAWLFIIFTCPWLLQKDVNEKAEGFYLFRPEKPVKKIIISFLLITFIFAGTMSYSILFYMVSKINCACSEGNLPEVKRLLSIAPYLINFRDREDYAPLNCAVLNGNKDIAEFLIFKGADVNMQRFRYSTFCSPLHDAVEGGSPETVDLLLTSGAEVNAKNSSGGTPLHVAANKGVKEIVELLLTKGAEVNVKDWVRVKNGSEEYHFAENNTPLHYAVESGSIETVELLLTAGAGVNEKNHYGLTPLDLAKEGGKPEMIALLEKHGGKEGSEL